MAYDGRYGKVASAMKRKRAVNRFGSPTNTRRSFQEGGGSQKVPPNRGVPAYKHGDKTTGAPQDGKAKRARPASMQLRSPSGRRHEANAPTDHAKLTPHSPKLPDQSRQSVKREKKGTTGGFRTFQSIVKGNVMGMRPPKKLVKPMRQVRGRS